MTKELLLFIQSSNSGLYVNVLTHCIKDKHIQNIYFAVNDGAVGKLSSEKNIIIDIQKKFQNLIEEGNKLPTKYQDFQNYIKDNNELVNKYKNFNIIEHKKLIENYQIYEDSYNKIKSILEEIEEKLITVNFANPEQSINKIKNRVCDSQSLLVDISGCNKKLASDIISSYILKDIKHICCFELDDEVFSDERKNKGFSKMYHDLRSNITYYEYIDFSKPGTTIKSFNSMRQQGEYIKLLVVFSFILGVAIFVLIQQQKFALAQYTGIIIFLANGTALLNNSITFFDRFK